MQETIESEPNHVTHFKRGPYTNWIKAGLLPVIHEAVMKSGRVSDGVKMLKESPSQKNIFERLCITTVRSWYTKDKCGQVVLKDAYHKILSGKIAANEFRRGVWHGRFGKT